MALRRCSTCNGSGKVTGNDTGPFGAGKMPCPGECRGEGWLVTPDEPQD